MRVPNPKDKKYWYKRIGSKLSREFDINLYLEDFSEWEKKLLHLLTNYASPCKLYPECYGSCRICIRDILGLNEEVN